MKVVLTVLTVLFITSAIALAQVMPDIDLREPVDRGTQSDGPIELYIDGVYVGTISSPGVVFDLLNREIKVSSNELIFGCQQDRFFNDRFEGRNP